MAELLTTAQGRVEDIITILHHCYPIDAVINRILSECDEENSLIERLVIKALSLGPQMTVKLTQPLHRYLLKDHAVIPDIFQELNEAAKSVVQIAKITFEHKEDEQNFKVSFQLV